MIRALSTFPSWNLWFTGEKSPLFSSHSHFMFYGILRVCCHIFHVCFGTVFCCSFAVWK